MNYILRYHKDVLAFGLGLFFINVGIMHFTDVEWFTPIVPEILPWSPEFWVMVSGIPEILCGIGLLIPQTRIIAGKATVFLLIVLYWANLNMWINGIPLNGNKFPAWAHILRMFAQFGMIAVAAYLAEWIPADRPRQD
ncbi:MAG: hypothetical protein CMA16_02085 [Euryarchaeota archaeon]|nr:hypothetical protein [Euryarchaeota archaeon]DAC39267.1 MAG TPA: DoxX family membrane protein [Candidatus Poseidoniales archaeon]HII25403.1 DoxX family membrane protein [Candidatus Poseidoniaceae archaeon]|tara:strand:- start:5020 stop:5433 length:414 start_codon:yes stop_codon:yes gene_type:complete